MRSSWLFTSLVLVVLASLSRAQRKPNIVFILTDDQDKRMQSLDYMPNVQNLLISEGTSYTRHYAPTALCCPARVSLLTGLHAHNHEVTDVGGDHGGFHLILDRGLNNNYLPIWLRDAGYKTYYTGKLYNGMNKDIVSKTTARGWTKADLLVGENTYQYNAPSFQHVEGNWNNPGPINTMEGKYTTNLVADFAYGYLKEAVTQDAPFFVGIAPIAPHSQVGNNPGPPKPAQKYAGTIPTARVPRADNFNPPDKSGVNFVWRLDRLGPDKVDILDKHYQARTEALLSVDDMVAEAVKILREANQLDNTYIIYSSDNGFHLGHHRLGIGKKYAFEEDINVPMIIRGPGVPKNRKAEVVSAHVDFAPTVFKIAGINQRPEFDGRPMPLTASEIDNREGNAQDEQANVEFWVGASYKMQGLKNTKVNTYKSLRLAGKGYDIMYAVHCKNNSHELYNMQKDPVQMRNLHPSAPALPGTQNPFNSGDNQLAGYPIKRLLQRIDALLLVLKSCKGNQCSQPWKELHSGGQVKNLRDAMDGQFDDKYKDIPQVRFDRCFKDGRINLAAEGPQWGHNGPTGLGAMQIVPGMEGEDPMEDTWDDKEGEETVQGWEGEGYWDDWE